MSLASTFTRVSTDGEFSHPLLPDHHIGNAAVAAVEVRHRSAEAMDKDGTAAGIFALSRALAITHACSSKGGTGLARLMPGVLSLSSPSMFGRASRK
jgi:hypothetical protein